MTRPFRNTSIVARISYDIFHVLSKIEERMSERTVVFGALPG